MSDVEMPMEDAASEMEDTVAERAKERLRWRAQADIRTLTEAARIRNDPKRFKLALLYAKKQQRELESIKD